MSYYAIRTHILPVTDTRGTRVVATTAAPPRARIKLRRICLPYEHGVNATRNHQIAAEQLVRANGWDGCWQSGTLPDGAIVWVRADGIDAFKILTPPAPYICQICGQRIDDGRPCGCGAR